MGAKLLGVQYPVLCRKTAQSFVVALDRRMSAYASLTMQCKARETKCGHLWKVHPYLCNDDNSL